LAAASTTISCSKQQPAYKQKENIKNWSLFGIINRHIEKLHPSVWLLDKEKKKQIILTMTSFFILSSVYADSFIQ